VAYITTRIFDENLFAFLAGLDGKKRLAINEGGTSSTKTWSILQLLIRIARRTANKLIISIVSESMPHLKRGCIRDFISMLGDGFEEKRWNRSDHIYSFDKSDLEFFSADQPDRLRGGRRDILFLNECNNQNYDAFMELYIRTRLFAFLDYNPVSEFWVHEKGLINDPQTVFIHSTYLDGVNVLPKFIIDKIESQKGKDPNWWNVYGLGLIGNVEGLVHPKFSQCDELPEGGKRFFGMDFGYSNDPTVLVENVALGDDLFSDQLIYEKGMTNDAIAKRMEQLGVRKGYDEIFADCAEPKSIEEIHRYGFNIKPAPKGKDSLETGIQKVNQYRQHWTKRSLECIKEQRNYRYVVDKNGKITPKPSDEWNHGMDARRYGVISKMLFPVLLPGIRSV
jgi:phage terminase large subunit